MDSELIPIYLIALLALSLIIYTIFRSIQSYQLKQKNLSKGIGRGVSGIQTSVRRVAIPPEIMERIRRGEEVSGEEITRAQERMKSNVASSNVSRSPSKNSNISNVKEDWLPPSVKSRQSATQRKNRNK